MATFLSTSSKNCNHWLKDRRSVEGNRRMEKDQRQHSQAKIGEKWCLNSTPEIYRIVSELPSGMTRKKVITLERENGKNIRSGDGLWGLQITCRECLQFRHVFRRDIGKSHSGSIMFFALGQLSINPNHLNHHIDRIQSGFRREKKSDLQVLSNFHLFWEKNL